MPLFAKQFTIIKQASKLDKKSQVLDRVSVDMLMVDLLMFEQQDCIGFDIELWDDNISVCEVAKLSETISYALFCGLTRCVSKFYIK